MFVARFSFDPEYDIQRGWTGYMGSASESRETVALLIADHLAHTFPRRIYEAYLEGDEEQAIAYVLENYDIRYHERTGLWMWVHNPNGLSCWPLEATSAEEALAEAAEKADHLDWGGFGWVTKGQVRYVGSVSSILHVFECEGVEKENEM